MAKIANVTAIENLIHPGERRPKLYQKEHQYFFSSTGLKALKKLEPFSKTHLSF